MWKRTSQRKLKMLKLVFRLSLRNDVTRILSFIENLFEDDDKEEPRDPKVLESGNGYFKSLL